MDYDKNIEPRVERPDQNDEHFDIIHRIKSGDFDNADYVLYGVLAGLNQSNHTSNISGTSNSMALSRLEIAIDFSLIDTTTHQVIASFVGLGSGEAHRIDGSPVDAQLEYVKLITSAAASLSENVALHLNSQAFVTADVNIGPDGLRQISGTEKFRFDERNFRIYQ